MANNVKSKSMKAVRGGSGHMVGKQSAGPSRSGSMVNTGGGGQWPQGGRTKMFGKQTSKPAKAC